MVGESDSAGCAVCSCSSRHNPEAAMPILPIIDLLILMGWSSLFGAFALKAIMVTTSYRPMLFGLGAFDLVVMAGIFLLFALALAARTWVKTQESQAMAASARAAATFEAYTALHSENGGREDRGNVDPVGAAEGSPEMAAAARGGVRG